MAERSDSERTAPPRLDAEPRPNCRSALRRATACAVLAIAVLTALPSATAQGNGTGSGFAASQFEPSPAQHTGLLDLDRPVVLGHLTPSAGLFFHFADDPVQQVEARDRSRVVNRLIDDQYNLEAGLALGLFDYIEVGVSIPYVLWQTGDEPRGLGDTESAAGSTPADFRTTLKVALLRPGRTGGFGLSASGVLYAPAGDPSMFTSAGRVRAAPRLSFGWRTDDGFEAIGNLGVEFGPAVSIENYNARTPVQWGLGGVSPLPVDRLAAFATLSGSQSTAPSGDEADPLEARGGVRVDLWEQLRLQFGGGAGLSDGVGTPDFRLFTSVHWADVGADTDGDGIFDRNDDCPDEPEDIDGFEDDDGCPDPDNDGDGIPDTEDECPDRPGPEERNGCPVQDRDDDGISDTEDECPDEPEDIDGFEDEDGCPDPDNDGDGIPDDEDDCPDEPETHNGIADEDGCPDESKAEVVEQRIEISEKIHFESDKAVIKPQSHDVLEDVARILNQYDHITEVRIEGHTDSRGPDRYNRELSRARAGAVKQFLTQQGVSADRLNSVGRGSSEPVATNDTEQGRAKNRRVEFVITKIHGRLVEDDEKVLDGKRDNSESSE